MHRGQHRGTAYFQYLVKVSHGHILRLEPYLTQCAFPVSE
jgi:hypothetical protein